MLVARSFSLAYTQTFSFIEKKLYDYLVFILPAHKAHVQIHFSVIETVLRYYIY